MSQEGKFVLGVSIVLFVVLLAVLFAVAAVTAGFGDLMKPTFQDARPVGMPEGPTGPDDIEALRFNVVLRGYKMTEVDAVLRRLSRELAERDAVLAELRGHSSRQSFRPAPPATPPDQPPAETLVRQDEAVAPQDEPTAEFFPTFADDTAVLPVVDEGASVPTAGEDRPADS